MRFSPRASVVEAGTLKPLVELMTSAKINAGAISFSASEGRIFMLLSVGLILLVGMFPGWLCKKMKLPALLGMLIAGMILGPYGCNVLTPVVLEISPQLRKIALIIILTRAGLGLKLSDLKKLGRPAILMCFVPASFELLGVLLFGPVLLKLSIPEAAVLGAVLAAVSPAVVVPKMVKLMEEGYGTARGIPQLILAGASVDDVYVIVLFSAFTGMMQGNFPEPFFFSGSGRGSTHHSYHLFGFDSHFVYGNRHEEKKRIPCRKIIRQVWKTLGGG